MTYGAPPSRGSRPETTRVGRAEAHRAFGEPEAFPQVGERGLRDADEPIGDVRGRHRARVREERDAGDAPLAQHDLDPPEAAGVVRDVGIDRVEDPDHDVVRRAGPRLVQARRHSCRGCRADRAGCVPPCGSICTLTRSGIPSGRPGYASWVPRPSSDAGRQLPQRLDHAPLAVVEPLRDEAPDRLEPVLGTQLLQPPLGDPRGAERRQVVAVPLLGHPDAAPAHPDHVLDVAVVLLDADAREVQRAFLVDVARAGVVRRRQRVAAVRLVRLRAGGEEVLAVDEDRHEDRVVGRVRVAEIGVVVQERVALLEPRMELRHRLGQELHADDVDRKPLGRSQQLVLGGDERAREVAGHVEHRRAPRAQQRVRHLPADAVEAVREHRQQHRIELLPGLSLHRSPSPAGSRR